MSAQNNGQRIAILVIVAVFLLTAVGATGAAIYNEINTKDDVASTTPPTNSEATPTDPLKPQEGKLQGTKLAGFMPVTTVDTLQKIDTVPGTGEEVQPGATVTAHYTGALASDGTIFQSSHDTGAPVPFPLTSVIKGWTEGVPGMKVGGTRRLVIPAALAYGANPPQGSGIPANAPLVFDIELVKIGE